MAVGVEGLRMALTSLWSHKLRSTMTILGVVIGVASVLAITSLSAAFEQSITSQFDEIDDRSILVAVGQAGLQQGPPDAGQSGLIFTEVDRQNLADLDGVDRVNAAGTVPVTGLTYQNRSIPFQTLSATTPEADEVRHDEDYLSGAPFAMGEEEVVLGYQVARTLSRAPVGADPTILPGGTLIIHQLDGTERPVTIAGVLDEQESLFGSGNAQVFVPLDPFYTIQRTSPRTGEATPVYGGLTIVAAAGADVDEVRHAAATYMKDQSDAAQLIKDLEGLDIFVVTASDITDQISSAFDQITLFIAGIAGISLLVGGIMIGTIMLITVTERTKEIGMMKAVGALDRQVLWAFLVEAIVVGFIGSLVGILLGLGAGAVLVATLFASEEAAVSFVVPWDWVGIAVLVGVGTGVVAGFFPARRATRIEPVEALTYE